MGSGLKESHLWIIPRVPRSTLLAWDGCYTTPIERMELQVARSAFNQISGKQTAHYVRYEHACGAARY